MNRLFTGSVAGLIATVPMTAAMEAIRRGLPGHVPLPPREVAIGLSRRVGLTPHIDHWGEPGRDAVTAVAHFGYGAMVGAIYGVVEPQLPRSVPPAVKGAGYGLLVWVGSYFALLPALGITRPLRDRPVRQQTTLFASHLVWGAAVGMIASRLSARV